MATPLEYKERQSTLWEPIESIVPQMAHLTYFLTKPHESFPEIYKLALPFEREYLRWQTTRIYRAPVEITGDVIDTLNNNQLLPSTGFEGYKFQQINSAAIVTDIAQQGALIRAELVKNFTRNGFENFMDTISGNYYCGYDNWMLAKNILEGLLARFRASLEQSEQAKAFRAQTDKMLVGHPNINYKFEDGVFAQTIYLPHHLTTDEYESKRVKPTFVYFNPDLRRGYMLMTKIGVMGIPIIRAFGEFIANPENVNKINLTRPKW